MENNVETNVNSEEINNTNSSNSKGINKGIIVVVAIVAIALVAFAIISSLSKGTKTLTCTLSQEENGMEINSKMELNFVNDSLKDLVLTQTIELGEMASMKDQMLEYLKTGTSQYEDDNFKISFESTDDSITMIAKGDNGVLSMIGGGSEEDKYDNVKSYLEDEGFTCK